MEREERERSETQISAASDDAEGSEDSGACGEAQTVGSS